MRPLRQLEGLIDALPVWGQFAIAAGLIIFSILSIYGRINVAVGAKVFSKIPADEIRSNIPHIIGYTVIPVIVTIGYLLLLTSKYKDI